MNSDKPLLEQRGLRPLAGVAMVLVVSVLVLGSSLLIRLSGSHQFEAHPPLSAGTPRAAVASDDPTQIAPTSAAQLAGTAAGTLTRAAEPTSATRTAATRAIATPADAPTGSMESTLEPIVRPTAVALERLAPDAVTVATATPSVVPDSAASENDTDRTAVDAAGVYTGLPVAVPSIATLDGVDVPVGPDGVRADGARAFAQKLLARARVQATLAEEPALRQVAEQVLVDELTRATPIGMVRPTRVRQGNVTVQIDIVATLPDTVSASLPRFSSTRVPAVGIAVGVSGRVEPDYLPDLVAVAAVAYR